MVVLRLVDKLKTNYLIYLQQGNYTAFDLQIDDSYFPQILPVGENYVRVYFYNDKELVAGFQINSHIKMV